MKIIIVVNSLGLGGTERSAINFCVGYKNYGHDVLLIAVGGGGARSGLLNAAGIKYITGDGSSESLQHLTEAGLDFSPDLIHVHRTGTPESSIDKVWTGVRTKKTIIVETNHFGRYDSSANGKLIDAHFQLSQWCMLKYFLLSMDDESAGKCHIISNPVDTEPYIKLSFNEKKIFKEKFCEKYGIPSESYLFGRVGQPILSKWHPIILNAFSSFCKTHKNSYLILVGPPKEYSLEIDRLNNNTGTKIICIESINNDSELISLYAALDIFLHASTIGETFGYVLIESMLCFTPVITLSTPLRDNSQVEIVGHMRGGIIVNNKYSMLQAMELTYCNPHLRENLATKGRSYAFENHGINRTAHLALSVIKNKQSIREGHDSCNSVKHGILRNIMSLAEICRQSESPMPRWLYIFVFYLIFFFRIHKLMQLMRAFKGLCVIK
jgi:glycosyltransferase involved in cell wall biosynthesis